MCRRATVHFLLDNLAPPLVDLAAIPGGAIACKQLANSPNAIAKSVMNAHWLKENDLTDTAVMWKDWTRLSCTRKTGAFTLRCARNPENSYAGKLASRFSCLNLNTGVLEQQEELRFQVEQRQLTLTVVCDPPVVDSIQGKQKKLIIQFTHHQVSE